MTYFIKTFGCQMNVSDSERVASFLESRGFGAAEKIEDASLVIINTCGVRQMAEDRVYGLVHNLKKNKPDARIVLTGCIAHRSDVQRRMKGKVDLFAEIKDIESILEKLGLSGPYSDGYERDYLKIAPKHVSRFQAYVPIMTGCDNFCAYCVVPYARGREVSRPAEEVVTEVKDLVSKGYKHITLLGQNVNSYHGVISKQQPVTSKNSKNTDYQLQVASYINFSQLLKKINSIPGKFWLTFVSSHPKDMSDELIETIAGSKKVCEMVHLPIQAGSDEVLRRMNRKYTQRHYLGLVRKIRKAFKERKPGTPLALTSDIIVGFPGETREQFRETAKAMEKAKYDMVYFGQFSPRPGTAAWKMKDNVSKKEKERREKTLNNILEKTALANNRKLVGKKMEVLVEKEKNGSYFGKTRTMKNVRIASSRKDLVGRLMKVKITQANAWNLEGSLE